MGGSRGLGGRGQEKGCGQPVCKEDGLSNSGTFRFSKVGLCERCFLFSNEKLEDGWYLFLSKNAVLPGTDRAKE